MPQAPFMAYAAPLAVLRGISAQWRVLQVLSECSMIHIGISLENKTVSVHLSHSMTKQRPG